MPLRARTAVGAPFAAVADAPFCKSPGEINFLLVRSSRVSEHSFPVLLLVIGGNEARPQYLQ